MCKQSPILYCNFNSGNGNFIYFVSLTGFKLPFDIDVCLIFEQIKQEHCDKKILIELTFHLIANYLQYWLLIHVIVQYSR